MRLLTVVTVVLGSVPLVAAPAAATGSCDRPLSYTAQAQADLLKLSLLDLRPLGLTLPQVIGLTLASSKAAMATDAAVPSTASAEYLDANVLGLKLPRGPLDARVTQQAPPNHVDGVRNNALSVDLGVAKAGTGDLMAHAEWADAMACGLQVGRAGSASAALLDAAVLPGFNGAVIKASKNLSSQAGTALLARQGRPAAAAGAEIGLGKLELLGTGAAAITIRVIEPPQLTAIATGRKETSTVEYKSPILEISGPAIGTRRLDGLGKTIDLPLPSSTLGTLLGGLSLGEVGKLAQLGDTSVVRLTIGDLQQQITDTKVTASASSLRLQVLASGASASQSAVVDLGIGVLQVSVGAPHWADGPGGNNPNQPPGNGCGGPGCSLPVTGMKVGMAAGVGILLFVLGRFLLILAGKRATRRA